MKKSKEKFLQWLAAGLSIYIFILLTLYVLGIANHLLFWISIILLALFAYRVLPSLREKVKE